MATESAHLAKAEANQRFLDRIEDEFADWMAIVAFYKGVHLIEAMLAGRSIHSHNHNQRNSRLKKEYPHIWKNFRPLFHASKLLRYTDHRISVQTVRNELIATRLQPLESQVRREMAGSE